MIPEDCKCKCGRYLVVERNSKELRCRNCYHKREECRCDKMVKPRKKTGDYLNTIRVDVFRNGKWVDSGLDLIIVGTNLDKVLSLAEWTIRKFKEPNRLNYVGGTSGGLTFKRRFGEYWG